MFGLGPLEVIIIIAVVVALFFGGKKLSEWARGLGRFSAEFKKGKLEAERELKELEDESRSSKQAQKKLS